MSEYVVYAAIIITRQGQRVTWGLYKTEERARQDVDVWLSTYQDPTYSGAVEPLVVGIRLFMTAIV